MVVQPGHSPAEVDRDTLTPLCDEAEFTSLIEELVAAEAPRLFAVVQEYGERADGWIAAWGMAFEDHAEVVGVERDLYVSLQTPERAASAFNHHPHITARVLWLNPDVAALGRG